MTLWMAGGLIEFTATGKGKVYLRGRRTYILSGDEGTWSPMGEILPLDTSTETQ